VLHVLHGFPARPDARAPARPVAMLGLCFVLLALHHLACPASSAAQPYSDALLEQLIQQSIAARPELQASRSLALAERERIPQAGAFPDPVLTLGMQDDGFRSIQIGKAETSFYLIELSQPLPWPGKRGLRTSVATLAAR